MTRTPVLELRFKSDPEHLKMVRDRVQETAAMLGCTKKLVADLVIAVNEACMNIMQHAYKGDRSGEIVLAIENHGGELEVLLVDFAAPVDPRTIKPRALDELRPGGLGSHFIREIMDDCVYGQLEGAAGNYLKMRKKIA